MNSSENISQSDGPSGKYQILTSGPRAVTNGHCNIGTYLIINRFNHSDNGYYWCQIISNNNCLLLQPSPYGYIAVGEIMNERSCTLERQLSTPICAEDSEMGSCISSSSTIVHVIMPTTTIHYIYNSTTAWTTLQDNKEFTREDNMTWLYGLMVAFLLVIIVLVLTLAIVSVS